MNQELIGSFIQERRKAKKLTQVDLSEKLGVSDRSVSKWERGVCLPDISLFKPLCKELDITINEFLNGKKDNNEDGVVNYIKYQRNKNKFKILLSIIISILVIVFSLLLIYFVNNYNKIKVYRVSGESDNFSYTDAIFITSNMKNIYYDGKLESNNSNININDITYMALKCDNRLIEGNSYVLNGIISEDYGYNEYFSDEVLEKLDKWYIEITYKLNNKETTEKINLLFENEMNNNNFINNKKQNVNDPNNEFNYEEHVIKEKENLEKLKEYLVNNGYRDDEGIYKKKLDDNSRFAVLIRTSKTDSQIVYSKDDYMVESFFNGLNHYFSDIKGKYHYYYEQDTGKIKCERGKCPSNMLDIAKEYVDKYNKEFKDVLIKTTRVEEEKE